MKKGHFLAWPKIQISMIHMDFDKTPLPNNWVLGPKGLSDLQEIISIQPFLHQDAPKVTPMYVVRVFPIKKKAPKKWNSWIFIIIA